MSKLEIVDPETGLTKEMPVSEFVMHSFKEALIRGVKGHSLQVKSLFCI